MYNSILTACGIWDISCPTGNIWYTVALVILGDLWQLMAIQSLFECPFSYSYLFFIFFMLSTRFLDLNGFLELYTSFCIVSFILLLRRLRTKMPPPPPPP